MRSFFNLEHRHDFTRKDTCLLPRHCTCIYIKHYVIVPPDLWNQLSILTNYTSKKISDNKISSAESQKGVITIYFVQPINKALLALHP